MRREAAVLRGLPRNEGFANLASRFCLTYFILCTAVVGSLFAYGGAASLMLIGRKYRPAWLLGGRVMRFGVDTLMRLQFWLTIEGEIRLPARCMTVSNHRSHLDMFILLARIPNIRAVAKAELFRLPGLGLMMRVMRQFPLERGSVESYWRTMDAVVEGALVGDPVHVFPEMTRCNTGLPGTDEFHLAPFRVALRAKVPLVPIVVHGTDRCWPKGHAGCFVGRVRVESLEPIDTAAYTDAGSLRDEARRRIEVRLRELAQ